jgi:hypothetical protein
LERTERIGLGFHVRSRICRLRSFFHRKINGMTRSCRQQCLTDSKETIQTFEPKEITQEELKRWQLHKKKILDLLKGILGR